MKKKTREKMTIAMAIFIIVIFIIGFITYYILICKEWAHVFKISGNKRI